MFCADDGATVIAVGAAIDDGVVVSPAVVYFAADAVVDCAADADSVAVRAGAGTAAALASGSSAAGDVVVGAAPPTTAAPAPTTAAPTTTVCH